MRLSILAALAGACVLALPSSTLAAEGDPCNPNTPAGGSIFAPSSLAVGREERVAIKELSRDALGGLIVISSADPTRPISGPVRSKDALLLKSSPETASYWSEYDSVPFRFGANDGPALITASWKEKVSLDPARPRYYEYCVRSATAIITPTPGTPPTLAFEQNRYSEPVIGTKWIQPCTAAWGLPVTLTVKATKQQASVTWADACSLIASSSASSVEGVTTAGVLDGRRFELDAMPTYEKGSVKVKVKPDGRTVRRVDWQRASGAQVFASGKFWARSTPGTSRIINEDEDDFVNVCINDTLTILKAGGELYCVEETDDEVAYYYKKKPKAVRRG